MGLSIIYVSSYCTAQYILLEVDLVRKHLKFPYTSPLPQGINVLMDHIQTHSTSHGGCVKGQQNHFHSIHIHFLLHSLFYNYWHAWREQHFSRSQEVENSHCWGTETSESGWQRHDLCPAPRTSWDLGFAGGSSVSAQWGCGDFFSLYKQG